MVRLKLREWKKNYTGKKIKKNNRQKKDMKFSFVTKNYEPQEKKLPSKLLFY